MLPSAKGGIYGRENAGIGSGTLCAFRQRFLLLKTKWPALCTESHTKLYNDISFFKPLAKERKKNYLFS